MKRIPLSSFVLSSCLVLSAACKSATYDQGAATGKSLDKAASQIELAMTQLDATVSALESLVKTPAPDLEPQFKNYSKSLSALESTEKDLSETAGAMSKKGQAYFAEWDKRVAELQNEDIKERSIERRKAVEANFAKIQENYNEAKVAFKPLMDDLRDVRTALDADLTLTGVQTLETTAKTVSERAGPVKEDLKKLADVFRELGVKLSKSGPPAPTPEK
jgi:vacuolar-type H+-ATPase subunit I/STV1